MIENMFKYFTMGMLSAIAIRLMGLDDALIFVILSLAISFVFAFLEEKID